MNRRVKTKSSSVVRERRGDNISVNELARFLRRLSVLLRDPVIGNPSLGDALAELADDLTTRPRGTFHQAAARRLASRVKPRRIEIGDFGDLSSKEVENMISDDQRPKRELVELGVARFGISRSRLMKMNKADVADVIRSALRHELSLSIISREARRGGTERSS